MPSKPFSDALKEKDRQKGIQSYAGGRRRGKPLLQGWKECLEGRLEGRWKEVGRKKVEVVWMRDVYTLKPPVAQRAGGILFY